MHMTLHCVTKDKTLHYWAIMDATSNGPNLLIDYKTVITSFLGLTTMYATDDESILLIPRAPQRQVFFF